MNDICRDGFNIDHALIGPTGVFAVETKSFSKFGEEDGTITHDGVQMFVKGSPPDRDPIAQAERQAKDLKNIIFQFSGMRQDVKPVVLVPGWKVDRTRKNSETWVINFEGLKKFLRHEPDRLSAVDVDRIFDALANYQRGRETMKP